MSDTAKIIDYCLRGVGEAADTLTAPQEMTRAEVLEIINQMYQFDIGKRIKSLASFSYDGSDPAHTLTAGVGTLPADFLMMAQVYDGDAPTNAPLQQIFSIEDKVADTEATSQYMLPDTTHIWVYGTTPTTGIKTYYHPKPTALTDSSTSSPTALKDEFHIDIFVAKVKQVYAMRNNNTYDALDMLALITDYLNQIEYAHSAEKRDSSLQMVIDVYGGY